MQSALHQACCFASWGKSSLTHRPPGQLHGISIKQRQDCWRRDKERRKQAEDHTCRGSAGAAQALMEVSKSRRSVRTADAAC